LKSSKELKPDDLVTLKKPHACGFNQWLLLKVGSSMELKCIKCNRKIILGRREFERRYKSRLE